MILYVLLLTAITYGPWILLAVLLWRSRRNPAGIGIILAAMVLLAVASSAGPSPVVNWVSAALLWLLLVGWSAFSGRWLVAGLINLVGLLWLMNFVASANRLASAVGSPGNTGREPTFVAGFIAASLAATLAGWLLGAAVRRRREHQSANQEASF